jgi:hypothetical protein
MIFRVRRDSIRQFRQTVSTRARQDGTRHMDGLPNGWTQYLVDHPADYSRLEPFPMTCFASVSLCLSPGCPADTSQVERIPLEFSSWIRSLPNAGVAQYSKHRFVCSLVALPGRPTEIVFYQYFSPPVSLLEALCVRKMPSNPGI